MVGTISGWALEAVRFMAGAVIGNLGFGGIISLIAGAMLLISLAANAMKFISHPKGIAFSGAAALIGLCLVWWMPTKPPTKTVVREVVREIAIPPPVVDTLHARIDGLEAKQRRHQEEQARATAARSEADALAVQAQERIQQLERDSQRVPPPLPEEPQPKAPPLNGECVECGHLMVVGRGLAGERIRCPNCNAIMGARRAWARRAYTLRVQDGQIQKPKRPFPAMTTQPVTGQMFE